MRSCGTASPLFVGHIAHGLVVHLHLQGVGLADGGLEHGHHNTNPEARKIIVPALTIKPRARSQV